MFISGGLNIPPGDVLAGSRRSTRTRNLAPGTVVPALPALAEVLPGSPVAIRFFPSTLPQKPFATVTEKKRQLGYLGQPFHSSEVFSCVFRGDATKMQLPMRVVLRGFPLKPAKQLAQREQGHHPNPPVSCLIYV